MLYKGLNRIHAQSAFLLSKFDTNLTALLESQSHLIFRTPVSFQRERIRPSFECSFSVPVTTTNQNFIKMNRSRASDELPVIKNVDMDQEQQDAATELAVQAIGKFNVEKDISAYIKKEFDKAYSPTWHCIVGKSFGSYVTHETKNFIYFYIGQYAFLLFKSG